MSDWKIRNWSEVFSPDISKLTEADILAVWSGDGCWMDGIHRYNSQNVELAAIDAGRKIKSDEIDDRMVKKVLRLLKANPEQVEKRTATLMLTKGKRGYKGKRNYVAYLLLPPGFYLEIFAERGKPKPMSQH